MFTRGYVSTIETKGARPKNDSSTWPREADHKKGVGFLLQNWVPYGNQTWKMEILQDLIVPSGYVKITIENDHSNSGFTMIYP